MCYTGICKNEDHFGECGRYNPRTCYLDKLERESEEEEDVL